jgi:plasmid stabilization system protein ParE
MNFRFLPAAETELLDAISYYSDISAELGIRFEHAISEAVRMAAAYPERGAPRSKSTRRWLVKTFPYRVIYRTSETEILIVAIAHQRKRPEFWADRRG